MLTLICQVESKQGLQDRIARLENVVQTIVDRLDVGGMSKAVILPQMAKGQQSADIHKHLDDTIHQLGSEVDRSSPVSDDVIHDADKIGSAPVLSMFDNAILSRHHVEPESNQVADRMTTPVSRRNQKTEKIRRTLLSLFPPTETEDQILKSSYWWAPWQEMFPGMFGVDGYVLFLKYHLVS